MISFLVDVFFYMLELSLFIILGCWLVKLLFGIFGGTARTVNNTIDSVKGGFAKEKEKFRKD